MPAICQKIENGQANLYEYMIAFQQTDSIVPKDIELIYNDQAFGVGRQHFTYK
ncbi:hypothetical protein [Paraflavitalea speifideaquila]|uniref:hypothetical protein n=1 Tax=Paraflavitalea speifideaquila TaxID=3076558 RepID=UPI0028E7CEF9|nr:hypothetical protein [Paraflavitalea speifideiaquila]